MSRYQILMEAHQHFSSSCPGTGTYGKYHNKQFSSRKRALQERRKARAGRKVRKKNAHIVCFYNLKSFLLASDFFFMFILSSFSSLLFCGVGRGVNSV